MSGQPRLEATPALATLPVAPSAGRQFSLAGLLGLVTWLAVMLGFAVSRLSNFTMLAVGFSLAGWNCLGKMAAYQAPPIRVQVRRGAWLLLLLSMFLPAIRGCGDATIAGWQAAGGTFVAQVSRLTDVSPGDTPVRLASDYLLITLLNLGNIIAALCPFLPVALERRDGRTLVGLFSCSAAAMWCLPLADPRHTWLIGYYAWCGAVLCLLATVPLGRRELAAMAAVAVGRWITLS